MFQIDANLLVDENRDVDFVLRLAEFYDSASTAESIGMDKLCLIAFCKSHDIHVWPHNSLKMLATLVNSSFLAVADRETLAIHMDAWRDFPRSFNLKPRWVLLLNIKHRFKSVHYSSTNDARDSESLACDLLRLGYTTSMGKAASALDVSLTVLKRMCKRIRITKWPYRAMSSLANLANSSFITEEQRGLINLHMSECIASPCNCELLHAWVLKIRNTYYNGHHLGK
jgi:hypothetical protein